MVRQHDLNERVSAGDEVGTVGQDDDLRVVAVPRCGRCACNGHEAQHHCCKEDGAKHASRLAVHGCLPLSTAELVGASVPYLASRMAGKSARVNLPRDSRRAGWGRRRRRRFRRVAGRSQPRWCAGRDHARRPAQLPPLPAAPVPGRDRLAVAGGDRVTAARHLQEAEERPRAVGRRDGLRPGAQAGPAREAAQRRGARCDPVRHAGRVGRVALLVLRSRRVAGRRAGPEVDRGRTRNPEADPDGVRGGRSGAQPGAAQRVVDVRRRRRRTDRSRDRGPDRRARRDTLPTTSGRWIRGRRESCSSRPPIAC